jgi:hypothetical protein
MQKRFCGDGPYATWAQQRRERDQQMNSEHEQFAHGANGTITVSACKTARRGPDCVALRIRHPQVFDGVSGHYGFSTGYLDTPRAGRGMFRVRSPANNPVTYSRGLRRVGDLCLPNIDDQPR